MATLRRRIVTQFCRDLEGELVLERHRHQLEQPQNDIHLAAPGTRPDRSAFVLAPKWFQEAGQLVGTTTTGLLSPPPPRTTPFRFTGPLWLFLC